MRHHHTSQRLAVAGFKWCRTVTRTHFAAAILFGLTAALSVHSVQDVDGAEIKPVRSMIEMRQDGVVMQKFDLSCGAAALATILTYQYGDPVPEREIARELVRRKEYIDNPDLIRAREGFSLADLKRYADARGYEGIGYGQLKLRDLIDLVPVLVPVNFNGYNHFVVLRGIQGDRVLLADPAYGNRVMRVDRFMDAWLDSPEFGRVGFVVAARDNTQYRNRLAPRPDHFMRPSDAILRAVLPFSGRR